MGKQLRARARRAPLQRQRPYRPKLTRVTLVALLVALGALALLVPLLYREARIWWVLNANAPTWNPSVSVERVASPYFHRRLVRANTIVIHTTEGSLASAIAWFQRNPSEVSSHYLIGKDGQIVQMVDERYAAHHAGEVTAPPGTRWYGDKPNDYSIGIELENDSVFLDPSDLPAAQQDALWLLAKDIVSRHHLPVDPQHIVAHSVIDPLNRRDPGPGFPWDEFLAYLEK